jgi:(p)ppGpp synthase/HD superfamily hydrolase
MTAATLGPRFGDAVQYAAIVHGGQTRKGSSAPYLGHLLGVAALVLEDGGDEDEAIAALLHDAAEDHGGVRRLADIEMRYGIRVRNIVHGCSDSLVDPKPPWTTRKTQFIQRTRDAMRDPGSDRGLLRVIVADKLHNLRAIELERARVGDAVYDRFSVPKTHTLAYYNEMSRALSKRHPEHGKLGPMARQLKRLVKEMGGRQLRLHWVDD